MHLVAPLAAGVKGAESGTAYFYARGTSTAVTYYTDFEASSSAAVTTGSLSLDANGGGIAYVAQLCTVVVKNSSGTTVRTFVAGDNDDAVEVISQSFTGADYVTAASAASKPTTLGAVLDLWKTNAGNASGSIDWKVSLSGTAKTLASWLGSFSGMFINVKDPAYGAVGDGVTDDTSAIQAAFIAGAQGNGLVVFPYGSEFKVTSSVNALCSCIGYGAAIVQSSGATFDFATDSHPIVCQGLEFRGAGVTGDDSTTKYGITFADLSFTSPAALPANWISTGSTRGGVHVERCFFELSHATKGGVTIAGSATQGNTVVRDCNFLISAATFNNSVVSAVTGYADINGNTFVCTSTAGTLQYVKASLDTVNVTNNVFRAGAGATVQAIEASTLTSGATLRESGNVFGTGVTRYVYASGDRDKVCFGTRDSPLGGVDVSVAGGASTTVAADQYGTVHFTAANGIGTPHTINFDRGGKYMKFRLLVYNTSGGAFTITWGTGIIRDAAGATDAIANNMAQIYDFECVPDSGGTYEWLMVGTYAGGVENTI